MMALQLLYTALLLVVLVYIAIKDIKQRVIERIGLSLLLFLETGRLLISFFVQWRKSGNAGALWEDSLFPELISKGAGVLAAVVLLSLCRLCMKEGIGMGDVKLMISLAYVFGIERFFFFLTMTSFITVAVTLILLLQKKIQRKDTLPFAPFIASGAGVEILWNFIKTQIG